MAGEPGSRRLQIIGWLARLEATLAVGLFTFIVVANTMQVAWRAVLHDPLSWTEEAVRVAFIWVVYVGAVMAVRKRTHISVDFFVLLLPERSRVWSARVNQVLYIGFFATVFVQAVKLTLHTSSMSLAVLPFPVAIIYVAGIVCGALSVAHLVLQLTGTRPVAQVVPC
jgi:TRAP-type C4-dicarboxylate transport system permease small subunit